jgi:hypothetical protein
MNNAIDQNADVLDSRDIIARIEELEGQVTERWVAGCNMPGYMPDSDPAEFESAEEAKNYIISMVKFEEDSAETEEQAEELAAFAEDVNLQSGEFSAQHGNWVYWVTLGGTMGLDSLEQEELAELKTLAEECEGYADWEHGETLIADDYFVTYIEELINDCYEMPEGLKGGQWPFRHMKMDYEAAAEEAKQDYTEVTLFGHVFWIRCV